MSGEVRLTRVEKPPFDAIEATRALLDAKWACEQAAAGHAKDINWLPIRDAMNAIWRHFHDMCMVYAIHLEEGDS